MNNDFLSNMIITDVNLITTIYTEAESKGKRINREQWAIIHKFEGETIYTSNGIDYISNSHNMVILPKGSNYEWRCVREGSFRVIEFECPFSLDNILYFTDINPETINRIFRKMESRSIINEKYCRIDNLSDAYSIIGKLIKSSSKKYNPSNKSQKIEPAITYIAENITKVPSNDFLAQLCGISTVYFRKLFTEIYGISPRNYIHTLKIKKATEMLRSDFGSISELAFSLGYSNVYDFSRDFKKHTGLSPKTFIQNEI